MTNESSGYDIAEIAESVGNQIRHIAEMTQKRTRLTARAFAAGRRVAVTVNADGVVIETKFSDDIGELDYADIARAVTEATQKAAAEVARRTKELYEPLAQERSRLPSLSEMVAGMPNMRDVDFATEASTAPPGSPERAGVGEPSDGAMEFTDVEEVDHRRTGGGGTVTDSTW